MKLVAAQNFYNTKSLGVKLNESDKLRLHADHIHTGARFSIGTAEFFKDLGASDQENVGTLLKRGLVVFDSKENADNGVIKEIDERAAVENAAYKKQMSKPPSMEELIAAAVAKALAK
jgi:hypothetical protein